RVPKTGGVPEILVAGQHGFGIAVDDQSVYWVSGLSQGVGPVVVAPKAGGDGKTLGYASAASRLVVDDKRVYYTATNQFISSDKTAGGDSVDISSSDPVLRFATDASNVYWITKDGIHKAMKPSGAGAE